MPAMSHSTPIEGSNRQEVGHHDPLDLRMSVKIEDSSLRRCLLPRDDKYPRKLFYPTYNYLNTDPNTEKPKALLSSSPSTSVYNLTTHNLCSSLRAKSCTVDAETSISVGCAVKSPENASTARSVSGVDRNCLHAASIGSTRASLKHLAGSSLDDSISGFAGLSNNNVSQILHTSVQNGETTDLKHKAIPNQKSQFSIEPLMPNYPLSMLNMPTVSPIESPFDLMYETHSGMSPSSASFGMTSHMLSYVMQKRRRHEARERDSKNREQVGNITVPSATVTSASAGEGECSDSESDSKRAKSASEEKKDDSYWERRRKNNEAAKRSRDARRQKEEEIAMRAAFLEQENLKLRAQIAILKNETAKLHYLLYNRI